MLAPKFPFSVKILEVLRSGEILLEPELVLLKEDVLFAPSTFFVRVVLVERLYMPSLAEFPLLKDSGQLLTVGVGRLVGESISCFGNTNLVSVLVFSTK